MPEDLLKDIAAFVTAPDRDPMLFVIAARGLCRHVEDKIGRQPLLPNIHETVGISFAPKTAALYFDRVWANPLSIDAPPLSCIAFGNTELEHMLSVLNTGLEAGIIPRSEVGGTELAAPSTKDRRVSVPTERAIAETLAGLYGFQATPLFRAAETRDKQYTAGDVCTLVAAIDQLEIVDERRLTWEQVVEFRKDEQAKRRYRRLVHWLDEKMVGRSPQFIAAELEKRLEDYEWAVKKHGLLTVTGTVSALIDPKFLAATAAASGVAAVAGSSGAAVISAGALTVARVTVSLAERLIDRHEAARAHREIAFVHELSRICTTADAV